MLTAPHIPSLGKKEGRRSFLKGSLLYCFKLCRNRHTLPLCQEHTRWDLCKAQLLCARAQGTSKASDTWSLLPTDCICRLLKKIPLFSKQPAKHTKPFQTSQAFAATAPILFEVDLITKVCRPWPELENLTCSILGLYNRQKSVLSLCPMSKQT